MRHVWEPLDAQQTWWVLWMFGNPGLNIIVRTVEGREEGRWFITAQYSASQGQKRVNLSNINSWLLYFQFLCLKHEMAAGTQLIKLTYGQPRSPNRLPPGYKPQATFPEARNSSSPQWQTWRDSFLWPSAKVAVTHRTPPIQTHTRNTLLNSC